MPTRKDTAKQKAAPRPKIVCKPAITLESRLSTFDALHSDEQLTIGMFRKAWKCPLCEKWYEYTTLYCFGSEHIVAGSGCSSHFYEGGRVDRCQSDACFNQANMILGVRLNLLPPARKDTGKRRDGRGK